MNAFKTLAEARGAYETLEAETADLRQKTEGIPALEAKIAEKEAFLANLITENQNFQVQITQKDGEIATLKTENSGLNTRVNDLLSQVATLLNGQKTVKQQARELVAATGGAPVTVDQGEVVKMQAGSKEEFEKMMLAEHNPKRLGELYKQYNELFRKKAK